MNLMILIATIGLFNASLTFNDVDWLQREKVELKGTPESWGLKTLADDQELASLGDDIVLVLDEKWTLKKPSTSGFYGFRKSADEKSLTIENDVSLDKLAEGLEQSGPVCAIEMSIRALIELPPYIWSAAAWLRKKEEPKETKDHAQENSNSTRAFEFLLADARAPIGKIICFSKTALKMKDLKNILPSQFRFYQYVDQTKELPLATESVEPSDAPSSYSKWLTDPASKSDEPDLKSFLDHYSVVRKGFDSPGYWDYGRYGGRNQYYEEVTQQMGEHGQLRVRIYPGTPDFRHFPTDPSDPRWPLYRR